MRVSEYLFGRRVDLALPLPPQDCAARLAKLVPAREWPTGHYRMLGKVQDDWLSLRYKGSLFERRYRLSLEGDLVADGEGARLVGRFGSPVMALALIAFGPVIAWLVASAFWNAPGGLDGIYQAGLAGLLAITILYFIFRDLFTAEDDWHRIIGAIREACAE